MQSAQNKVIAVIDEKTTGISRFLIYFFDSGFT